VILTGVALLAVSCSPNEANQKGVGASCSTDKDCQSGQTCLNFKGGYCGVKGCFHDTDCPTGSACVAYVDGSNYCFLTCVEKIDCNQNRPAEYESNCSSNVTFVDGKQGDRKACVPPSG
jgi:hypothetical protein